MPITSAPTTSQRLLSLLSLLQARRDWPGALLADRLEVSERTVRRDVDRLRELGYPIHATKGRDGGYRLDAGTQMPPLLFDDEQAVALALALRTAVSAGAGIEEAAARALSTVRQVMPARLRARIDALEMTAANRAERDTQADVDVLLAIGAAIRAREELRFDYRPSAATTEADSAMPPVRRVQPHHLVARAGRWYVVGWESRREEWRIYRADRMTPRIPNGPRFTPKEIPGGNVDSYLEARFKGSQTANTWPCQGEVIVHLPAEQVVPFAGDGTVEALTAQRCRLRMGSWSWTGLTAALLRFDADLEDVQPAELRDAFMVVAERASRAAAGIDA